MNNVNREREKESERETWKERKTKRERVVYRLGVLAQLARKTYHIYMHSDPNSACTKNTFFVHALARQFCMYAIHIWPTVRFRFRLYRLGVLDHLVRKTYLAYIHSNPNCPCTPNKPDLHKLNHQRGLTRQRARSTPLAGPPTRVASQ